MILTGDYHTHTPYSDGKNTVLENAIAAKEKGLKELGITDHGFNHIFFGLRRRNLPDLKAQIDEAKRVTGVNVLAGMESNLISINGKVDMRKSDYEHFDIFICGIHEAPWYHSPYDFYYLMLKNVFASWRGKAPNERSVKNTTKAYINAVKNNPIDILTHINFRTYCDVVEVAKACADYGTYMEINTKKYHVTAEELYQMAQTGVKFIINSDAHTTDRIGDIFIAEDIVKRAGVPLSQIDNIDGKLPNFRFAEYKRRNL